MKRRDPLRHLSQHGCSLLREGGNHSWWHQPELNRRSAIPRHTEIKELLVRKICSDLGVPRP
ncbi:type II toxin-antitoxin system HicA family toxin [Cyanobium sp. ATX 6E8]|jgi:mRNA interferase HicA|uniref:type II toxin-antitoxin system HicA family toxin n=1 Tax=Cyanobium sp. ATX 6E8 TaxID=2823701 RepID=UPI0020CD1610|nr:type II toxin-antitoxin system HicA family toxin [Cyanobium sp. ATX 6E8]MCP9943417.1 type II toxin-antitoxin system HicA family toxin [Cyanobium sp. ATX 6E8]